MTSFQSWVLFRFGWEDGSPSTVESPSWLVRRNESLDRLFLSSSGRLGVTELMSDPVVVPSPALRRASRSARFFCSSFVNSSTGSASKMSSAAVGSKASTVYVQSVWFCSNRRRKLRSETRQSASVAEHASQVGIDNRRQITHFSLEIRSLLMRSRASEILDSTYCPARYPTPMTPVPIARVLRLRRNQRLVALIMVERRGIGGQLHANIEPMQFIIYNINLNRY